MTTTESPKPQAHFQWLLDDARDFPATMALGAAWLIVFALMLIGRVSTGPFPSLQALLVGNLGSAHAYGDLTLNDLARGELWRVVTCTFVHYNALHVGMNLYGLYQLGALVESWYGSGRFLAIYLVVGGGGNLVSAFIRQARGMDPRLHSGGGSTVVLGLVALCAVVGWRSRSRFGDFLRGQMVGILLFTAFLGQMLPMIDNWGHAGGALVGALVGFAHRKLIDRSSRALSVGAGVLASVILLVCGAAQWRDHRHEQSYRAPLTQAELGLRETQLRLFELSRLDGFYQLAALRAQLDQSRWVPSASLRNYRTPARTGAGAQAGQNLWSIPASKFRTQQAHFQALLKRSESTLGTPPTEEAYDQVCHLLDTVFRNPPTPRMALGFRYQLQALIRRTTEQLSAVQTRRAALARAAGLDV